MRVAELDERRILAPARRLIEKLPVAAGGGRGRLTTPARTPQVGGPATRGVSTGSRRKIPPTTRQDGALRRLQRATAPRERDIQRDILAFLNAMPGVYAWKAGAGLLPLEGGRRVRMGRAGVSDVIGWLRCHLVRGLNDKPGLEFCRRVRGCYIPRHVPVWFAVEVKRPKGGKPPSPAQLDFLARLREAGSPLAMVATSADEVRRAIEAL